MMLIIFLIGLAQANDFTELKEVTINYKNYELMNKNQRNLLIYPNKPKEGLNLSLKIDGLYGLLYFNPEMQSVTDNGQYRGIGLEVHYGIHLSDFIDVGLWHHSQHVLDMQGTTLPKFPAEDAVEVRFTIYRSKN